MLKLELYFDKYKLGPEATLKLDLFQPLIHSPHVIEKWSTS